MAIAYGTPKLVAATVLAVITASLVHFLARGIAARRRFYKMKASGIVSVDFPLGCRLQTGRHV